MARTVVFVASMFTRLLTQHAEDAGERSEREHADFDHDEPRLRLGHLLTSPRTRSLRDARHGVGRGDAS